MCRELLELALEPALNRFKMVCPEISVDDLLESLLALILEYEQPCDVDKSLEVSVEH